MKRIAINPEIASHLRRSLGDGIDTSQYIVYEAIALNTLPIRKRHPLYYNAINERSVLSEMSARVIGESIPLMIMHDDEPLPTGRVFHAEVFDLMGESELRALFFVDPQEAEVINKIDNGTVDQVSVSVVPRQATCSECGWDFFGPESDFENIFFGTCANGHVIGQDNVHVKLKGLDSWFEMSLVSQGGARNARIVSRDQSAFGSTNVHRLAASGMDPNHLVLAAGPEGEDLMDIKQTLQELLDNKADTAVLTKQVEDLTAALAERDAEVERLAGEKEQLEARIAELEPSVARVEELEARVAEDTDAVRELAKQALAQTGETSESALEGKDTIADLVSVISDSRAKLGVGGKALDAAAGSVADRSFMHVAAAFRVPR